MPKNKFTKPPLTEIEKERRAEEFMNLTDKLPTEKKIKTAPTKKEPVKSIYLRAPKSYLDSIKEIMILTGLSMNAVCLELLRPAIKRKLKDLKEN